MSSRAADARLVLPEPVAVAAVVDAGQQWRDALTAAGCRMVDDPTTYGSPLDLVVTSAAAAVPAGVEAQQALLIGRGDGSAWRRAGYSVEPYFARPGRVGPRLVVPARHRTAVRYLLRRWSHPPDRAARARNAALSVAVTARLPAHRVIDDSNGFLAATRSPGRPWALAGAATPEAPLDGEWILVLGDGDELQRAVFHVFGRRSATPTWAVKLSRVRGHATPFDRDEAGLRLVARAGPATAAHAPRHISRALVDGHHVSVETAAVGRPMHELLAGALPVERKHALIDAVAEWTIAVGRETAGDPAGLAAERARLRELVASSSIAARLDLDVVDAVPGVPSVLQHNDLGSWNILVGGDAFTVVDWESARQPGLPLWDLVYFLTDVLLREEGGFGGPLLVDRVRRLYRGELPSSPRLFRWLRTAAAAAKVPKEAVGSIVTLGWLHHATSRGHRVERLDAVAGGSAADERPETMVWERTIDAWVRDPLLGPRWTAWTR